MTWSQFWQQQANELHHRAQTKQILADIPAPDCISNGSNKAPKLDPAAARNRGHRPHHTQTLPSRAVRQPQQRFHAQDPMARHAQTSPRPRRRTRDDRRLPLTCSRRIRRRTSPGRRPTRRPRRPGATHPQQAAHRRHQGSTPPTGAPNDGRQGHITVKQRQQGENSLWRSCE